MNIPEFINVEDWKLVNRYCVTYGVNPYLIAAIGWHETNWGKLGWGRRGFILGVGCYSETNADYAFQGLENQLKWAVPELSRFVPFHVNQNMMIAFAEKIWRPGNPKNWGRSVYYFYTEFMNRYGSDLWNYTSPPQWARECLLEFYEKGYLNTPYGDNNFYRLVVIFGRIIKDLKK